MFMFRKKNNEESMTKKLKIEADEFQKSVIEIENRFKNADINIDILNKYSEQNGIDINIYKKTFEPILKNNALNEINKIKAKDDFNIVELEKAARKYGFGVDDLHISLY
jgi:hypothetical protein